MKLRTCVSPEGKFIYGIHHPRYRVKNLRNESYISSIGTLQHGGPVGNSDNFPDGDIEVSQADRVYEIPNAFPFKGTTYISEYFADTAARDPGGIALNDREPVSLSETIKQWAGSGKVSEDRMADLYRSLPEPLVLALATTSTDAGELVNLARLSCQFVCDENTGRPTGVVLKKGENGQAQPAIDNYPLYKALANNPFLPDEFKGVMVLKPGIQGISRITGEWKAQDKDSHVFEYLRRNSYIPWGHYAANMADDAIRYHIRDLTLTDMTGMRHLYYQRTYIRIAESMGFAVTDSRKGLSEPDLEGLRTKIHDALARHPSKQNLEFSSTLWGWNYGFDCTPTGYRLHGSHQQIHQQYALVPASVAMENPEELHGASVPAFACGDLIDAFIREYRKQTGKPFFDSYIRAVRKNRRMDGYEKGETSLVVYENEGVMLFVPKAQTSQWELQLITLKPMGNIIETDSRTRKALDRTMLIAVKVLSAMGARIITGIEYAKRFDDPDTDQRLLYCFLPRLPQSPGAFSEAQLRWINRHFPEDFASACRRRLPEVLESLTD
ncbi:MAG: hypothetical protein JRK53_27925 [Deltaproteobacteria bacterium]|nr:hypothetical protein [Deltaproteobacteria bacterium]